MKTLSNVTIIYQSILAGITATRGKFSRLIWNQTNFIPTLYVIDAAQKTREFCIRWNTKTMCSLAKLPRWDGIEIIIAEINEYPSACGTYLIFQQLPDYEADIFETVIADLEENIQDISDDKTLSTVVQNVLLKWKEFFSISPDFQLSLEKQQGLYGELLFLKKLIEQNGCSAVYQWSGPDAETHDFYIAGNAVEIKTSSKKTNNVIISSESQLDQSNVPGDLYLVFYSLRHSKVDGESLHEIVSLIQQLLNNDLNAEREFTQKLFKTGYHIEKDDLYLEKFTLLNMQRYLVSSHFPKIIRSDLKNGISSVSYSLDLSVCENYLINSSYFEQNVLKQVI